MEQDPNQLPQKNQDENVISDYMEYMQQSDIEFHQAVVKKARNALYLAGVLIFVGEMIGMAKGGSFDITIFIVALIEAGIFIGLALWTRKKPYSAVIGGLIAFIGILLLSIAINAYALGIEAALMAIFGGIIFKVFIIAALVNALRNAKTLQSIQSKGK